VVMGTNGHWGATICIDRQGTGHLQNDRLWEEHLVSHGDEVVQNATYTHCWDPSCTRLFTAGGPLPFGLRGCYMALWQR
jgi:WD repeat-containing protein 40A